MRRIDWKVIVLLGIIVSVVVGFLFGTGILGGDSSAPGSADDPLMSQGAAEQTIDARVATLEQEINDLTDKITTLETDLTELYAIVNQDGTVTTNPGTNTGTNTGSGNTGTTTGGNSGQAVSSANIGKTGSVTSDVVNLRESASTSSTIKKKLTPSDTFTITKVDNDWYQVQLPDGTVGWVAGYLVKVK